NWLLGVEAHDSFAEGPPFGEPAIFGFRVARYQVRHRAVAARKHDEALSDLRNTEVGGIVQVERYVVAERFERCDDVGECAARKLLVGEGREAFAAPIMGTVEHRGRQQSPDIL